MTNLHALKVLLIAASLGIPAARAATVTKSATGTDLTAGASWGGTAPTATDDATWTGASLGGALTAATAVNWGTINISGATANIAISGAGTITTGNITLTGSQTLGISNAVVLSGNSVYDIADATGSAAADATLSGIVSGAFGITKNGTGTLVLSGANTYTGATVVNAGRLVVGGGASGSISASSAVSLADGATIEFASNTSTATATAVNNVFTTTGTNGTGNIVFTGINTGATTGATAGTSIYSIASTTSNAGLTSAASITLNGARITVGAAASLGSATVTLVNSGAIYITNNGTYSNNFILQSAGWGELTGNLGAMRLTGTTLSGTITLASDSRISAYLSTGNITGNIVETGGSRSLDIGGSGGTGIDTGNLTLSGTNTYTGNTTVNAGTLTLNYATNDTGKLSDTGALILKNSGSVVLSGGTHTEIVGSTILGAAAFSTITQTGGTATIALGAITRSGGTINFTTGGIATTTSGSASSVLQDATTGAAYATVGGTDWAAKDASNSSIVGLSTLGGYTAFADATNPVTLSGNADLTQATAGTYTLGANSAATTIRNTTITGNTLALGGFTLTTSGILSNVAGTVSGAGTIMAGSTGGELVINQTAGTLTVSSAIADNGTASSFTKTGAGTVMIFNTAWTYTGVTYVDKGTLQMGNNLAGSLATSGIVVAQGATFQIGRGSLSATQNITGAGNFVAGAGFIGGAIAATIAGTNNNYTGSTSISLNPFTLATGGVINGTSSFSVSGINNAAATNNGSITTVGTVTVNGGSSSIAGLFTNNGVLNAAAVTLGSSSLTAAGAAHGGQFSNAVAGTVNLGAGAITVGGSGSNFTGGTLTAAGSTFSNAGTVTAGTLTLNNSAATNTVVNKGGTYTQTGGTTTLSGALALVSAGATATPYAVGAAGNDAALNLSGGTLSSASASLNGTTTVSGTGTLNVAGNFYMGDAAAGRQGTVNQTGGTVSLATTVADSIRFGHWGTETSTYNISGGTFTATGADIVVGWDGNGVLNVSGGTMNLRGIRMGATQVNSTHNGAGTFSLTGGTVNIGATGIVAGGTGTKTVGLGAGTLGASANWSSSVAMTLTDGSTGVTVNTLDSVDNTTARTITLSGVLDGAGKLVKTGTGTLTLSGANLYAGGTTINAGSIVSANVAALGSGAVTLGGGTLTAGAAGITGIASLTVNTGTLGTAGGNVTTTGAFTLSGGTWIVGAGADTLTAASFNLVAGIIDLTNLALGNKTASGYSLIAGTGTTSLTNANFIGGASGYSYALDTNGDLQVTAVPEPAAYGLLGAGALAAAAFVRRRRKTA